MNNTENQKYYAAYEQRYRAVHAQGLSWSSDRPTPIVLDVIRRYAIRPDQALLELGCGEGRDAKAVLDAGFDLTATDISCEAVSFCRRSMPAYSDCFSVLDCLSDRLDRQFDFIYAVAVVHMLVPDEDRRGFYRFIRDHLTEDGLALICAMGDGERETQTDIREAFALRERAHAAAGRVMVAATSCRMVSFPSFDRERSESGLATVERGLTAAPPEFDSLMYAVARRDSNYHSQR